MARQGGMLDVNPRGDTTVAERYQRLHPTVRGGGFLILVHGDDVKGNAVDFIGQDGSEVKGVSWRQRVDFVNPAFVMTGCWIKVGFQREKEDRPNPLGTGVYHIVPRWSVDDDGMVNFQRTRLHRLGAVDASELKE